MGIMRRLVDALEWYAAQEGGQRAKEALAADDGAAERLEDLAGQLVEAMDEDGTGTAYNIQQDIIMLMATRAE